MITSNALWKTFKTTLDMITTEDLSRTQVAIGKGKLFKKESMKDAYIEDTEVAGLTVFPEKIEGADMSSQDVVVGGTKRYRPTSFALKVVITHEALRDCKYDKVLQPNKRLRAAAYKTQDISAADVLLNATAVTGGYDSVVLCSTSHVLPTGGSASNYINSGAGMSPSTEAISAMRTMAALMPGANGMAEGVSLKGITFPEAQLDLWKIITRTPGAVGSNINDINTVKDMDLTLMPVKWYDAVSTDFWAGVTDAENGLRFLVREDIKGSTWLNNDGMAVNHGEYYSCALGWSNWRCVILGHDV